MVNEPGMIPSLPIASPRDVVPFSTGAPSRGPAAVVNGAQAPAGHADRPGSTALFSRFQLSAEQRADAAVLLRRIHADLQQADQLLTQIKEKLMHIVKQYPPFSHDDPQRMAYLNGISGLRKQLDALSFPQGRQVREQQSPGTEGQVPLPDVAAYPVKGDLAIPELDPRTASDAELGAALDAVTQALDKVLESKGRMWQDVVRFVGEANLGPSGDASAQARVGEIQGYIAAHPARGGIGASVQTILSLGA